MVVVITSSVGPADDTLEHHHILPDCTVDVHLYIAQIVHKTLQTVFVKIVKGHFEVRQSILALPVTKRPDIVAYRLVLLSGFLRPVV